MHKPASVTGIPGTTRRCWRFSRQYRFYRSTELCFSLVLSPWMVKLSTLEQDGSNVTMRDAKSEVPNDSDAPLPPTGRSDSVGRRRPSFRSELARLESKPTEMRQIVKVISRWDPCPETFSCLKVYRFSAPKITEVLGIAEAEVMPNLLTLLIKHRRPQRSRGCRTAI